VQNPNLSIEKIQKDKKSPDFSPVPGFSPVRGAAGGFHDAFTFVLA
jgi:hypothetical protein